MKHAWKCSRFAAAILAAALLLTSGVLAKGGLVTAIGDYRPGWTKVEETAPEETAPSQEPASEDTAQPAEGSADEAADPEEAAASAGAAEDAAQPEGEETAAEEPVPYIQPAAQTEADWWLLLVNPWNDLPEGYTVELTTLSNGLKVDRRIYEDLQAMLTACRKAGLNPVVCSAYRTQATQVRLYNNKIARLRAAGWTGEALLTEAARWVAPPGTSEHQTGLALDIVSARYQVLDEKQEDTAEQQWLMEHSWEYGFILRYPEDKTEITGIGYEPWHYRYVGRETAAAIHESGLCLEEYLPTLSDPVTESPDGETALAETDEAAEAALTAENAPAGDAGGTAEQAVPEDVPGTDAASDAGAASEQAS